MQTEEIFYVGIGNQNRPYDFRKKGWGARSKLWWNIVEKYGFPIVIIQHENLILEEAIELEKFYIQKIGRRDSDKGPLVNHTDGGEGCFNWGTEEQKLERSKKISDSLKIMWETKTPQERSEIANRRSQSIDPSRRSEISSKSLNTYWSNISIEEKNERMNKLHDHESMSSENRSERAKEFRSKMSYEDNAAMAKKREDNMTDDQKIQRSEKVKAYLNSLSPEEKSERKRKAWETRRNKNNHM